MFKTIINYAFRNLIRARLRSFFTLVSVSLIILLYSVLTSVGTSFSAQISKVLDDQNVDIAIQAKNATNPSTSMIDKETSKAISEFDEVKELHALLVGNKRLDGNKSVVVLGVSNFNTFAQRLGFSIVNGRAIHKINQEIVIGEKAAKIYGFKVGDKLEFRADQMYTVVGIYSSWLSFLNSGLITDIESVQSLVSRPGKSSLLFLKLDETTQTSEVVKKINSQFPDMRAMASKELPDHLGPIKSVLYLTEIVSIITLFVAAAVLLNTFIMAIGERTKEIGILSAIGWDRKLIVTIFLVESLILSIAGSVIGYLSSYAVFPILQSQFLSVVTFLPNSPPNAVLFNVFLMAIIIGILSAIFPALYGTRIQVAKALRYE